jgi:hypothetical protein
MLECKAATIAGAAIAHSHKVIIAVQERLHDYNEDR